MIFNNPNEFSLRKIGSSLIFNNEFTRSIESSKGVKLSISKATSLLTTPLGEPFGELGSTGT
jgi:hypothetical protein